MSGTTKALFFWSIATGVVIFVDSELQDLKDVMNFRTGDELYDVVLECKLDSARAFEALRQFVDFWAPVMSESHLNQYIQGCLLCENAPVLHAYMLRKV